MKVTADTNVLLRAILDDDPAQQRAAVEALEKADLVAIGLQSLCEFSRVLECSYAIARADIAAAVLVVLSMRNVAINRPAAEAGLSLLEAGGDFADGVIAYEGRWLGGDTFVSFDKKAVKLLAAQGRAAHLQT